jgi:ethanolamine utilization protein EutJ
MDWKSVDQLMGKVEESERQVFTPVSSKLKVGVDLGTAYVVIVVLDQENNPVACEKEAATVIRDGLVVDYQGATVIVKRLKEKLENRLGQSLTHCAIAMPAGTNHNSKTHVYVVEGAGFEVTNIVDEASSANNIYKINHGVIVDIGGGTTGLALIKDNEVVQVEDEPTGGTHVTLVLAGNYKVSIEEAEKIKQDFSRHREILPIINAVIEKMAYIIKKYVEPSEVDVIYLCGGTSCLTGIEGIIERETKIKTYKPENPLLVTPTGIAMSCEV